MATRRTIHCSISLSETVAQLSEFAQLLLDRIIIHADDWGVIEGTPTKIKAKCMPLSRRDVADFADAVAEIIAIGTAVAYLSGGKTYLRLVNFDAYQTGLHKRTSQKHLPLDGVQMSAAQYFSNFPGNSGKFREIPGNSLPTEGKRREEKRKEEQIPSESGGDEPPPESDEGVVYPTEPPEKPLLPQQQKVRAIMDLCAQAKLSNIPTGGRAAQLDRRYGVDLIRETIADLGSALDGRDVNYLASVLEARVLNPSLRPQFRQSGSAPPARPRRSQTTTTSEFEERQQALVRLQVKK